MTYDTAILGATGAVGLDLLRLLEERSFPVGRLRALASERSRGAVVRFRGEDLPVEVAGPDSFQGVELAFFSAGSARSKQFAPQAVAAGATVIDNSSAFRMDPAVPLVVPEINPGDLAGHRGIIANPNCTTIITLLPVAAIHRHAEVLLLRAASYQAASGAGARAMAELSSQLRAVAEGRPPLVAEFPHQLAMNVIPQVGAFLPGGETEEEAKLRNESRRILHLPGLRVSATCVRVPVLRSHSVAVWVTTRRPLSPESAREILWTAPGVKVVDDPATLAYPMPISAAGTAPVQVGRLRADESTDSGLAFFVAGDQLLKGAALNAVQIAEALIEKGILLWQR
jgi:aspartate-semialdehyde dehydrogenase